MPDVKAGAQMGSGFFMDSLDKSAFPSNLLNSHAPFGIKGKACA